MKDVAALAKVSLKTVSRVINNEPTVNPELTARVRLAAEQLRYQPNFGASALRRSDGRSSTIGVLLEDLSNPFSATIYRAVEEVATLRSVSVLGGSLDESSQREHDLTTSMSRHRVDGVIIAPASHDHHYLRQEQEAGVAFVFVDRPPSLLAADQVLSDCRGASQRAVEHLISFGHKRIGYLGDATTISTAVERNLGYADALKAAGIPLDPSIVFQGLRTIDSVHEVVATMIQSDNPPTALFTGQNLLTMGAVRELRELGLQHEIALVGFDDFLMADLLDPPVTVVAQDVVSMGREAAHLLFDRIDGDRSEVRCVIVPSRLVVRGSGEIPPRY
jgi:LacI family transcriptional regulator